MTVHLETELKLKLVEPKRWEHLLTSPLWATLGGVGSPTQEILEGQYFDTPSRGLQKAQLAYRIRLEEGCWLATLKAGGTSGGGLHCREEYTVVLTDPLAPAVKPFLATSAGERLQAALNGETLVPLFVTRFTRYKQDLVSADGSRIELAIDIGEIVAGDQQAPIAELELELKEGNAAAVLAIGAAVAQEFPLLVEARSKFSRGLALAGLSESEGNEPAATSVRGNEPVTAVLQRLLIGGVIDAFAAQDGFLQAIDDPEALHRLRIAIRRLHSALSFTKPLLPPAEYEQYQEALRQWNRASGITRELDATAEAWQELLASGSVTLPGKAWLGEVLTTERRLAVGKIYQPLAAGSSTSLLLEIWSWIVGGAVGAAAAATEPEVSIKLFARGRLHCWLQELLTAGNELDLSQGERLHRLRILGKKLRYMLDMLSEVSGGGTNKLIGNLKRVQDRFGYVRDVQLTATLLQDWLRTRSSRALHRDAGLLMGWEAHAMYSGQADLLRSWKQFCKAARHWSAGKGGSQ